VPPPSTIYGFLLSLAGEEDRMRHAGARIALAVLREPQISVVLRTAWRIKELRIKHKGNPGRVQPIGIGSNKRPDYQEILTGLEIGIWVAGDGLAERLRMAAQRPDAVDRFGGLSLGESRDLINDIDWFPEYGNRKAYWLVPRKDGNITLPVWVDHVGSDGTVWQSFVMVEKTLTSPSNDSNRWISIHPMSDSQTGPVSA
jgi:CRISPR-associated protein Cas5t